MAVKTWFVTNTVSNAHQEMSETSPGAEATSSPNYGWTVGSVAPTAYAKADGGVEVAAAAFAATPVEPDGSIDTTVGDCWRSANKYTGSFAEGVWTFTMRVIAVSAGGSQDGNAGFRLFRSANADGSSATEITSGRLEGGAVTNLIAGAAQDSAHSATTIPAFSLTDEYVFVQIGWEITGAGSHGSPDVIIRIGDGASRIASTDFSPVVTGAAALTGSGTLGLVGSLILAGALALSGSGTLAAAGSFEHYGAAALTGTATIAASGTVEAGGTEVLGAASLAGAGTLAAAGSLEHHGALALSGSASLAAAGSLAHAAAAVLAGTGALEAAGTVSGTILGAAALAGSATLAAAPVVDYGGAALLEGTATLAAVAAEAPVVVVPAAHKLGPYTLQEIDKAFGYWGLRRRGRV